MKKYYWHTIIKRTYLRFDFFSTLEIIPHWKYINQVKKVTFGKQRTLFFTFFFLFVQFTFKTTYEL